MNRSLLLTLLLFLACHTAWAQVKEEDLVPSSEEQKRSETVSLSDKLVIGADTLQGWKTGASLGINFSQTSVSNWQSGAQNNLAFNAVTGMYAKYNRNNFFWHTLFDGSYGLTRNEGQSTRKANDYWEMNTNLGRFLDAKRTWAAVGFAEAISQFTPGYDYEVDPDGKSYNSAFMAPGYLMQGVGLAYEYSKDPISLSGRLSPATARQIVVMDPVLDETEYGLDSGDVAKLEFGASFRLNYNQKINKTTNLESRLILFTDYLEDAGNVYVNWRSKLDMKVTKIISINLLLHLIYDPQKDFTLETEKQPDGTEKPTRVGPVLQYLQNLGVGVSFNLSNR
ncbi:MAG: DUF3078 domain-containing protein [Bacteroidetes bacterium]|jgi:hypothetical protein|nr:DUF3078 domain-containing protein [Bacteroidota bacterium]